MKTWYVINREMGERLVLKTSDVQRASDQSGVTIDRLLRSAGEGRNDAWISDDGVWAIYWLAEDYLPQPVRIP